MSTENPFLRSMDLLWNGLPEPRKGPKPTLTLDQIVDAAIGLADAEGIDALSMRRLAGELDVGTMSLYRYVPGKFELLNLILDRAIGSEGHRFDDLGTDWRSVLERSAWQGRAIYLRHPWLLQVNHSRPLLGPHHIKDFAALMHGLRDLAMGDKEKVMLISALDGYVIGTVRDEIFYDKAAEETGVSEDEFWEMQVPVLTQVIESGEYPALAELDEDAFLGEWEETFRSGLTAFLDGVELRVARERDEAT